MSSSSKTGSASKAQSKSVFAILPGLGDRDYPGFLADEPPAKLPDLADYRSIAADVLRTNASLYATWKDSSTDLCTSFGRCIKPCMDNPISTGVGAVAGDAQCYTLFKDFFDKVIFKLHDGTRLNDAKIPSDTLPIDASGKHAVSVYIRGDRNLKNFRFPSACAREERKEVEAVLRKATWGRYYPLSEEAEVLSSKGILFHEPKAPLKLSSGIGRHWPEGRGICVVESEELVMWFNDEDHLSLFASRQDGNVLAALKSFNEAMERIEQGLRKLGENFAFDERLGYLTTCPSNIGTTPLVVVRLWLPQLSLQPEFRAEFEDLGLHVRPFRSKRQGEFEVTAPRRHNSIGMLIDGCRKMVAKEVKLSSLSDLSPSVGKAEGLASQGSERKEQYPKSVYAILPGLGDRDYPGFPTSAGPAKLPDLVDHRSIAAEVLRNDVSLYPALKDSRTSLEVSFERCIKPCIDNASESGVGAVAGDAECYTKFKRFFEQLVIKVHGAIPQGHGTSSNTSLPSNGVSLIDLNVNDALSICIKGDRNISGFRFPSACVREERKEVESILVNVLSNLRMPLQTLRGTNTPGQTRPPVQGSYFPLQSSTSFFEKPFGMSKEETEKLASRGVLFQEPKMPLKLSSGIGRHWPEARGVFLAASEQLVAWINEEDHLSVFSLQHDGNLKAALARFAEAMQAIEEGLAKLKLKFAFSDNFGYLTTCPSDIGSNPHISMRLSLPYLSRQTTFHAVCEELGLKGRLVKRGMLTSGTNSARDNGVCEITVSNRLGVPDIASCLANGCRQLLAKEGDLTGKSSLQSRASPGSQNGKQGLAQSGNASAVQQRSVFAILPGLGDRDYPGFLADESPLKLPSLVDHLTIAAKVLQSDASLFKMFREKRTMLGVSFGRCIKPCMDNPSSTGVGAVAGDAECYTTFKAFFDQVVVKARGLSRSSKAPKGLRGASQGMLDPLGKHALSICIRADRNISRFRFPSACDREERKEVESILLNILLNLHGLATPVQKMIPKEKGSYYPLPQSTSFPTNASATSREAAEKLASKGILFHEPRTPLKLSSGIGRHWPEARGVFVASSEQLVVWINDEDHLSLFSMQPDGNIEIALRRLEETLFCIEKGLGEVGLKFAFSDHLGYLTTCPSNVASIPHMSVILRLPSYSRRPEFDTTLEYLGLQARRHRDYSFCVEPMKRFGAGDADNVTVFVDACRQLIEHEMRSGSHDLTSGRTQSPERMSISYAGKPKPERKNVFAILPGLDDRDMPGFPADVCPKTLPDLKDHLSVAAKVLRDNSALYVSLKDGRTRLGVSFARCIKPCMDHPRSNGIGAVAGDAESYVLYKDFFDVVVRRLHGHCDFTPKQNIKNKSIDASSLSKVPIDPSGRHVLSISIRGDRNISGFRFTTSCAQEERREIEATLVDAAFKLPKEAGPYQHLTSETFQGTYHPLMQSTSFAAKPSGMTPEDAERLSSKGMLFHEPRSPLQLSSGIGKHWPEARGVFMATSGQLAIWVNEEDHLSMFSLRQDGNLQDAVLRYVEAMNRLENSLASKGRQFSFHEQYGYLTACPGNIGLSPHMSVILRLPFWSKQGGLVDACRKLGLAVKPVRGVATSMTGQVWDVALGDRVSLPVIESANLLLHGCRQLVTKELENSTSQFSVQVRNDDEERKSQKSVFAVLPGLGSTDLPGFSVDAPPSALPNLAQHRSLTAEVLQSRPSMYRLLKDTRTKLGVSLARCIKPCMDDPSDSGIGSVAGDAESYTAFQDLFDSIIMKLNNVSKLNVAYISRSSKIVEVSKAIVDPSVALFTCIRGSRNLDGFRFLPACEKIERRNVEEILVRALSELSDEQLPASSDFTAADFKGSYYPLQKLASLGENDSAKFDKLHSKGFVFREPRSRAKLSSGIGRDWPDARGIFVTESMRVVAWINEENHLTIVCVVEGGHARAAFDLYTEMWRRLEKILARRGVAFARNDRLGYLTVCPGSIRASAHMSMKMNLPSISSQEDFREICRSLDLHATSVSQGRKGVWEITVRDAFSRPDGVVANALINGCKQLALAEASIAGKSFSSGQARSVEHRDAPRNINQKTVFAVLPGLGDTYFPGFPVDHCPEHLPSLVHFRSLAAEVLRDNVAIYGRLKHHATRNGITLALCIKPAMDNPDARFIGAVAGDEESYDKFKELFDPIIQILHGSLSPGALHPYDMSPVMVRSTIMDPSYNHVLAVRIESRRNLRGFRFSPACSRVERNEVENILVQALSECYHPAIVGEYYPLANSSSYAPKPNGMNQKVEAELKSMGFLFCAPQSQESLSSGFGRHWPEGRGVFVSNSRRFTARINEEDHLHVVSIQYDANIQEAYRRFASAMLSLDEFLDARNGCFARNSRLGHITTSPANLGGGLKATVLVQLPFLPNKPAFHETCDRLGLRARKNQHMTIADASYTDVWELSNADHYSLSDAEVVNLVVEGCLNLLTMEVHLETSMMPVGSGQKGARMLRATQSSGGSLHDTMPREAAENRDIRKLAGSCDHLLEQARPKSAQRPGAGSSQRSPQHKRARSPQRGRPKSPKSPGRTGNSSWARQVRENVQLLQQHHSYYNDAELEFLRNTMQAKMSSRA